jgi:hypothetical protein
VLERTFAWMIGGVGVDDEGDVLRFPTCLKRRRAIYRMPKTYPVVMMIPIVSLEETFSFALIISPLAKNSFHFLPFFSNLNVITGARDRHNHTRSPLTVKRGPIPPLTRADVTCNSSEKGETKLVSRRKKEEKLA